MALLICCEGSLSIRYFIFAWECPEEWDRIAWITPGILSPKQPALEAKMGAEMESSKEWI